MRQERKHEKQKDILGLHQKKSIYNVGWDKVFHIMIMIGIK